MSSASITASSPGKGSRKGLWNGPWHLWVVAILSFLWNASGAYTIVMAQAGRLAGMSVDEAAYYAAQPLWFVLLTGVALFAPLLAAIALIFRSRHAVWLFALSLVVMLLTNAYDLVAGTSRMLVSNGAMVMTCVIFIIGVLQFWYARSMARRGVLN